MERQPRAELRYFLTLIPSPPGKNHPWRVKEVRVQLTPGYPPLIHRFWEEFSPPELFLIALGGCSLEAMLPVLEESVKSEPSWELCLDGTLTFVEPKSYIFQVIRMILILPEDLKKHPFLEKALCEHHAHCPLISLVKNHSSPGITLEFMVEFRKGD